MSNDKHIPKNPPAEAEHKQHDKQHAQHGEHLYGSPTPAVNQADGSKDELNNQRGQHSGPPIQTGKPPQSGQTGQHKGAEPEREAHKPDDRARKSA